MKKEGVSAMSFSKAVHPTDFVVSLAIWYKLQELFFIGNFISFDERK